MFLSKCALKVNGEGFTEQKKRELLLQNNMYIPSQDESDNPLRLGFFQIAPRQYPCPPLPGGLSLGSGSQCAG